MKNYGFNMLCMFGANSVKPKIDDAELDFIAEHGFNYIRLPLDYRAWIKNFDYANPDERGLEIVDGYIAQCLERGLHACVNFHRAPGYCINRPDLERDNLWTDEIAQDGFVRNWEIFATRYKDIPPEKLSFNLVNEPWWEDGKLGFTRERHAAIMRRAIAAIRAISPDRDIVLDGINGGNTEMPELADTGAIQSVRGYTPFNVTHYKAGWISHITDWPEPAYPAEYDGVSWNRDALAHYYRNWRALEKSGVRVMVGEFGCYDKTPNDVALRWFRDLLSVYREFGWGFVMWNFNGPFGIVNHNRPGAKYTTMNGLNVDAEMLALMKENRVNG